MGKKSRGNAAFLLSWDFVSYRWLTSLQISYKSVSTFRGELGHLTVRVERPPACGRPFSNELLYAMRFAARRPSAEQQHNDENRKRDSGNNEKDCFIVENHSIGFIEIAPLLIELSPPLPIVEIEEITKQSCGQDGNATCKVKNRRDCVPP